MSGDGTILRGEYGTGNAMDHGDRLCKGKTYLGRCNTALA